MLFFTQKHCRLRRNTRPASVSDNLFLIVRITARTLLVAATLVAATLVAAALFFILFLIVAVGIPTLLLGGGN